MVAILSWSQCVKDSDMVGVLFVLNRGKYLNKLSVFSPVPSNDISRLKYFNLYHISWIRYNVIDWECPMCINFIRIIYKMNFTNIYRWMYCWYQLIIICSEATDGGGVQLPILLRHDTDLKISVHYDVVIMGAMASQITSLTIDYSTVYSGADQRKHQSSAPLAFVRGIHRGPGNSPHKWPVTRKMFLFDDVIMNYSAIVGKLQESEPHTCFNEIRTTNTEIDLMWSCIYGCYFGFNTW